MSSQLIAGSIGLLITIASALFTIVLLPIARGRAEEAFARWRHTPEALSAIDDVLQEIRQAISYTPHRVRNKDNWIARLNEYAEQNRATVGELHHFVRKLAWRIQDSAFDHDPTSIAYCCDELRIDLTLLRFALLEVKLRCEVKSAVERTVLEQKFLDDHWTDLRKKPLERLTRYTDNDFSLRIGLLHAQLKSGSIDIDGDLAMPGYFRRRQEAQHRNRAFYGDRSWLWRWLQSEARQSPNHRFSILSAEVDEHALTRIRETLENQGFSLVTSAPIGNGRGVYDYSRHNLDANLTGVARGPEFMFHLLIKPNGKSGRTLDAPQLNVIGFSLAMAIAQHTKNICCSESDN